MAFKYKPRSGEQIAKRASQSGGQYDSCYKSEYKVWSPKEGDHRIRVLPPTFKGAEHYGIDVWINSNVGPDNNTYLSLSKMKNEPDPIAEAVAKATRAGRGDEEWVKQLKPYRRVLMWVIVRGEEKEGPQLYPMPWTLDRDFTKHQIDKQTGEVLPVDDPENGYDFEFTREGTKRNTNYVAAAVARRSTPLSDNPRQAEKWLAFVEQNPLPDTLNYYDYDYISKVFNAGSKGDDESTDDSDDGDKAPKTRAGSRAAAADDDDAPPPPKRRAEPVDDDDAPPPPKRRAEPVDDDDAPPPPKRRAEPVDDDDAPPPPKRRAEPVDDETVEVRPRKPAPVDDDDAPPPPKRKPISDPDESLDDDAPPPPKRKPAPVEDDDEAPPAPKRRPAPSDDD